jgi:hypothetical protein
MGLKMYNIGNGVVMDKILPMLLIAGIVAMIFGMSAIREKKVRVFTDEFAKAFIEASDHVLVDSFQEVELNYIIESMVDSRGKEIKNTKKIPVKLAPLAEQPEALQKLFMNGIDPFILERFKIMHVKRDGAQMYLTSINMIEKKYNSALNRIYDIANISFSALEDYSVIKTLEDVENFHVFLQKQRFLRQTTLSSIMSKEAKSNVIFG